jgi:peroxiredoxin Q/BCP
VTLGVGDQAPEFTLPGTGGRDYSLAEFRGRPVVLVFYPGDDTPVCTKQLNRYNDDLEQFSEMNAQVIGISAQDVTSHDAFAGKHGFDFPLLADTDKSVIKAFGQSALRPAAAREAYLIDRQGKIVNHDEGQTEKQAEMVLAFLNKTKKS